MHIYEIWHRGSAWIVGPLCVGLLAVGLATGGEYATELNVRVNQLSPYSPLLLMPLGFMLLRYLSDTYFPGTSGSGIPQTIAALSHDAERPVSHLLSLRIAIGKIVMTLGGLACGASIGREGPTVQIGASVMHFFYGKGPFQNTEMRRTLILAGGAAGIAAAFNTPLAGIMFAIEELSKKHVFTANSSTLMTVVVSGLISLSLLGNYTYFGSTAAYLEWDSGLWPIVLCGITGGIAGGIFSRIMIAGTFSMPDGWLNRLQQRKYVYAASCGLIIAIIGLLTHQLVFGTGYQSTKLTLENSGALPWYFGIAKMVATLLSSLSSIPGGLFAPSLAVGAGFGDNLANLFPDLGNHSAIVLLVMSAYLSGVTRAPLTSFIIMMEMTNSHEMLIPLMAASVIASRVSKFISRAALYEKLAERFER